MSEEISEDIRYECILSSDITDIEKQDFLDVFNEVFNVDFTLEWFTWKYQENIYGDSNIILAYDESKLVGIRSFWRNDIEGEVSYQPCDTGVLEDYRGKGIFSKMSLVGLDSIEDGFIYNYPNDSSLPGNLKLGWETNKYYYLKLVFNRSKLKSETRYIPDNYLVWKFGESPLRKYSYYEKNGENYLLYERAKNMFYVLGSFNSEYNKYFTKAKPIILFNYTDEKTTLYKMSKKRGTIVSFEKDNSVYSEIDIPIFKGDFF